MVALLLLLAFLAPAGHALAAPAGGADAQPVPGALLHARLTAQRKVVRLQEVFDFTVAVYSRDLIMGRDIALRSRETPGLTFLPYVDLGSRRETVDGRAFDVHRFRGRAQAVATGTFTLQPEVSASVVLTSRGRDGAPAGGAEVRRTELLPAALSVTVLPLPEAGKPEGYAGAVGNFTFKAAARPAAVAEGEPVTVTMEIEGSGNIESLASPRVPADERFRLHEPKQLRREISADRSRGRLVFEQTVVPRSTAATAVPAVTFGFFDPAGAAYRTLVAGPFPLKVRAGARAAAVVVDAGPSGAQRTRPALGADIAPLKPEPRDWSDRAARRWYGSFWFFALQLVPPLVVAALALVVRRREELARDVAKARRRAAPGAARSRLFAAEQALGSGDPARFHEALWEALASYFANRLNLLPGQLSREAVTARLAGAGLDPGSVAALDGIFRISEQERFGRPPSPSGRLSAGERERLAGLLGELGRLLEACEGLQL